MKNIKVLVFVVILTSTIALTPAVSADSNSITHTYNISGIVRDSTLVYSDELFTILEETIDSNHRNFDHRVNEMLRPEPLDNIVITLRGKSVTRQTVTDANGKFEFKGLPCLRTDPNSGKDFWEDYEISAQIPVEPKNAGDANTVTLKQFVSLDYNKFLKFEYRSDLVTVKGRIIDPNGQPVGGTTVIGKMEINDGGSSSSQFHPQKQVTVSADDGSYELKGFIPPDFWHTAGYLNGGNPMADIGSSFFLVVTAKADGFTQTKENTPKIPLVSEELLIAARRMHKILYDCERRTGDPNRPYNIQEGNKELNLPTSTGNTITGVDIILTMENPAKKDK